MQLHDVSIVVPKVFIGMDIHKKNWSISIQTDLFFHKTYSMPSDQEVLYQYVSKNFVDHQVFLVYEAGCCGFHNARFFANLGWNVMVVNPGDVKKGDKQRYQKTDAIDAKNLSDQLKKGDLKPINIPTEAEEQLQTLARTRQQITRNLRRSKVHIKSMLLFHGVKLPVEFDNPNWSIDFIDWLDGLKFSYLTGDYALQSKIRSFKFLKSEYLEIANQLRAYCRKYHKTDYYLLMSIPGIGGFLAAVILAECGDLRRFSNESQFSSFVGMIPGMYNSGESEKSMGITPRSRGQLRSYLIEATWVAIRKDPEMQAYYRKHAGKNVKSIIVKVGHKLVRRILGVVKTGVPYQVNNAAILA